MQKAWIQDKQGEIMKKWLIVLNRNYLKQWFNYMKTDAVCTKKKKVVGGDDELLSLEFQWLDITEMLKVNE